MYIAANIIFWLLAFGVPVLAFLAFLAFRAFLTFWVPTARLPTDRRLPDV